LLQSNLQEIHLKQSHWEAQSLIIPLWYRL